MKRGKLFLGLCGHYSTSDVLFVQSLCGMLGQTRLILHIHWNCDPSVERSRNANVATFLESDCEKLLFIDSDVGFTVDDVARIASHNEEVVGGMYPIKRDCQAVQWCCNSVLEGGKLLEGRLADSMTPRPDGLQEVRYMGAGFLCIHRSAFEKILTADRAAIEYQTDTEPCRTEWAFFRQGVFATADKHRRFLTEDWFFCQRWLELGGRVFADTQIALRHAGRAVWPLSLQSGNPFVTQSTNQ